MTLCPFRGERRRPSTVTLMVRLAGIAVIVSACTTGRAVPPAAAPAASPSDPIQSTSPARSGHLLITALSGRCGIYAISGTHALLDATGQFCRVRIRVASSDTSQHDFHPDAQTLILTNGSEVAPSVGAMSVKRQPDAFPLGPDDQVELVIWWEIPADAKVMAIRLVGDHDADADGGFVTPSTHPAGVVVPLHGLTR